MPPLKILKENVWKRIVNVFVSLAGLQFQFALFTNKYTQKLKPKNWKHKIIMGTFNDSKKRYVL